MATYRAKKHKVKDVVWQSVVTGSTLTAVAGNGYWIDTTSNACTITLPASASVGDTIIFIDYARNWGTNKITIDSNGLNYQGDDDSWDVEYSTDGMTLDIVYVDATKGWIPTIDEAVDVVATEPKNSQGIFGYGQDASVRTAVTNLVSNAGVVATDVTGVGTARSLPAACENGGDKGIFGYGSTGSRVSMTNLVSNTGVVATDTTGVGSIRWMIAACEYGGDKGIFGYGWGSNMMTNVTNLVSNTGVVSTDVTGVGTARHGLAACEYGGDKGIFLLGDMSWQAPKYNLVSNVGVVATDTGGQGGSPDIRNLAACEYGGDKGIFGYGYDGNWVKLSSTYLISNAGVVGSEVTGVGTARSDLAACSFN